MTRRVSLGTPNLGMTILASTGRERQGAASGYGTMANNSAHG